MSISAGGTKRTKGRGVKRGNPLTKKKPSEKPDLGGKYYSSREAAQEEGVAPTRRGGQRRRRQKENRVAKREEKKKSMQGSTPLGGC